MEHVLQQNSKKPVRKLTPKLAQKKHGPSTLGPKFGTKIGSIVVPVLAPTNKWFYLLAPKFRFKKLEPNSVPFLSPKFKNKIKKAWTRTRPIPAGEDVPLVGGIHECHRLRPERCYMDQYRWNTDFVRRGLTEKVFANSQTNKDDALHGKVYCMVYCMAWYIAWQGILRH